MATFVTTEKLSKLMDAVKTKIATKLDATGIKNDATTTDAGYVLDARMGKTLGDRATTLETKVSDLYFATDSNGKWGYRSTKNGAVTPFRNPTGDATAAEVLSGKTFSSASLENATGTMANRGAWTGETTGSGNVTIPEGYHNGKGYVSGAGAYNAGDAASTKVYYLGTGTTFSAAAIPGYKNFTVDNFVIRGVGSHSSSNMVKGGVGKAGGGVASFSVTASASMTFNKSYDASTGVLTCSCTFAHTMTKTQSEAVWTDSTYNKDIAVNESDAVVAYCIVDLSKVKTL